MLLNGEDWRPTHADLYRIEEGAEPLQIAEDAPCQVFTEPVSLNPQPGEAFIVIGVSIA